MTTLLRELTRVPLESPCDEAWDQMRGDERVRRCDRCARDVFHVSAMSPLEAELRLLNSGDLVPCIRYLRDGAGNVVHAPRVQPRPARSLVAATALGVTLSAAAPAFAGEPTKASDDAPAECVAYAAAFAEAPAAKPAAAAAKPAPAKSAPADSPSSPPPEPRPVPLAGKPMMPQKEPIFGTLTLRSKVAREVTLVGITLQAPLASYLLSPGEFTLEVGAAKGDKKKRKVRFTIQRDKTTVVDLDKR